MNKYNKSLNINFNKKANSANLINIKLKINLI